jgi:hypothetical protein
MGIVQLWTRYCPCFFQDYGTSSFKRVVCNGQVRQKYALGDTFVPVALSVFGIIDLDTAEPLLDCLKAGKANRWRLNDGLAGRWIKRLVDIHWRDLVSWLLCGVLCWSGRWSLVEISIKNKKDLNNVDLLESLVPVLSRGQICRVRQFNRPEPV